MKGIKSMKNRNIAFTTIILFALGFFALLPKTQATPEKSPTAPETALPGFNTADGDHALFSLTTGVGNAAVGWYSLFSNTNGSYNTALGAGTLVLNVGDQSTGEGNQNTAVGTAALLFNVTGSNNTALGALALYSNTTGNTNTAVGESSLYSNTTGVGNTAEGDEVLASNTSGSNNTAIGFGALSQNTIGSLNIAVGPSSGFNLTTGSHNIDIGSPGVAGESDTIRIGDSFHTATYIAGISGQAAVGGDTVLITADGKLGTLNFSSERFKEKIKPMDKASEAILALRPVTFRYNNEIDPEGIAQFGLVAEEVDKVNPDLVKRNAKGEIYTVRYEAINAMLLNEFIKAYRTVQELKSIVTKQAATIAQQERGIETLAAHVKEQDSKIQKVSAQLELRPAPQVVLNN